jgi:hypothetical protein
MVLTNDFIERRRTEPVGEWGGRDGGGEEVGHLAENSQRLHKSHTKDFKA